MRVDVEHRPEGAVAHDQASFVAASEPRQLREPEQVAERADGQVEPFHEVEDEGPDHRALRRGAQHPGHRRGPFGRGRVASGDADAGAVFAEERVDDGARARG